MACMHTLFLLLFYFYFCFVFGFILVLELTCSVITLALNYIISHLFFLNFEIDSNYVTKAGLELTLQR